MMRAMGIEALGLRS